MNEEYYIEIDNACYDQDYDEAYPGEEKQEYQETNILFE